MQLEWSFITSSEPRLWFFYGSVYFAARMAV